MTHGAFNSAVLRSPCTAEAKSAAPVRATSGAALDVRGYAHGNRPATWLKPGMSERLVKLHADGISFAVIAAMISTEFNTKISRNACIGRAKRQHLPERSPLIRMAVKHPPSKPKSKRLCLPRKQLLKKPLPAQVRLKEMRPGRSLDLTIYELHAGVCHWPYGNNAPFKYCGRSTQGGTPWCSQHHVMVYVKPSKVAS